MPPVLDYTSHIVTTNNDPFDVNYAAALAPYEIDMMVPTNAPALSNNSQQIYSTSSNVTTSFLLWL